VREGGAGAENFSAAGSRVDGGGVGAAGGAMQGEDHSVDESEEAIEDLLFA